MRFRVYQDPSKELYRRVAEQSPANPFMTAAYAEARVALGCDSYVFSLEDDGGMRAACPAFLRSGYLTRSLEIMSLPLIVEAEVFWTGVESWCRSVNISGLEVNTFGSEQSTIPMLRGEQSRRRRREYILDLGCDDLHKQMSSNHARNIKRARKAGVQVRSHPDAQGCLAHVTLMAASMTRRRERGEQVPDMRAHELAEVTALVERGAGVLFQAVADEQVLSSILVLQSELAGYYHSAGTTPEGMACGASHVLVYDIAVTLRRGSKSQFNLGGVSEPGSGLEQFKRGFGARRIDLEAIECSTATRLTRWLGAGAMMLRQVASAGTTR